MTNTQLAEYAGLTAIVAGFLGYRMASLTNPYRADRIIRVVAVLQYAVPVALATAVLRTLGLQRLYVPALLTLLVYVVTAVRDSQDPIKENYSLLQELAILGMAALTVTIWGLLAR